MEWRPVSSPAVLTIDVEAELIEAIRFVANPDKLAHI